MFSDYANSQKEGCQDTSVGVGVGRWRGHTCRDMVSYLPGGQNATEQVIRFRVALLASYYYKAQWSSLRSIFFFARQDRAEAFRFASPGEA